MRDVLLFNKLNNKHFLYVNKYKAIPTNIGLNGAPDEDGRLGDGSIGSDDFAKED